MFVSSIIIERKSAHVSINMKKNDRNNRRIRKIYVMWRSCDYLIYGNGCHLWLMLPAHTVYITFSGELHIFEEKISELLR